MVIADQSQDAAIHDAESWIHLGQKIRPTWQASGLATGLGIEDAPQETIATGARHGKQEMGSIYPG